MRFFRPGLIGKHLVINAQTSGTPPRFAPFGTGWLTAKPPFEDRLPRVMKIDVESVALLMLMRRVDKHPGGKDHDASERPLSLGERPNDSS